MWSPYAGKLSNSGVKNKYEKLKTNNITDIDDIIFAYY